jgi:very-short-patch-repair endonuclease
MNEITSKIKTEALANLRPLLEEMAEDGKTPREITEFAKKYIDSKIDAFYKDQGKAKSLGSCIQKIMPQLQGVKTSEAERILCGILEDNNIPYRYQYKIGPYFADYLLAGDIVLELDGLSHINDIQKQKDAKRDKYMRRMGYRVIRIPLIALSLDTRAVIEVIKEAIAEDKIN